MSSPTFDRLAAWSGVLAGLCIGVPGAVEAFTGETGPTSFVLGMSPALALPLLVLLHRDVAGAFGALGFTVNLVGLGLFGGAAFSLNLVLFHADQPVLDELLTGPTRVALLGSALVFAVGAVLFGAAMVRARAHPRAAAVAYAVSLPALALAAPLPDSPLTSGIHVVAGVSVAWLAVSAGSRVPALSAA